jgi:hypothetical protein
MAQTNAVLRNKNDHLLMKLADDRSAKDSLIVKVAQTEAARQRLETELDRQKAHNAKLQDTLRTARERHRIAVSALQDHRSKYEHDIAQVVVELAQESKGDQK